MTHRHQKTKAVTENMLRLADLAEKLIGVWLGVQPEGHFSPVDLIIHVDGIMHGIEVKALTTSKQGRVVLRKLCRVSKQEWAGAVDAVLHTVAVDLREEPDNPPVYYRKGIGSYWIKNMVPVMDPVHLKRLLGSIDAAQQLDAAAGDCPF